MKRQRRGPTDGKSHADSIFLRFIDYACSPREQVTVGQRLLTELGGGQVVWCFLLRPLNFESHPLLRQKSQSGGRGREAGLIGLADGESHRQSHRQTSTSPPETGGDHGGSRMHDCTQACLMPRAFLQRSAYFTLLSLEANQPDAIRFLFFPL